MSLTLKNSLNIKFRASFSTPKPIISTDNSVLMASLIFYCILRLQLQKIYEILPKGIVSFLFSLFFHKMFDFLRPLQQNIKKYPLHQL